MTSALDWLRYLTIFCAAISAGSLVMSVVLINRATEDAPSDLQDLVYRALGSLPDPSMRLAAIATGIGAAAVLVLQRDLPSPSALVTVAGLVGTLGTVVLSELCIVPIRRRLGDTSVELASPQFLQLRHRWNWCNSGRAASALLALVCYILAGLAR